MYFSICAIVRDEPYLSEWVKYHRIVGAEHFYLYDNGSAVPIDHFLTGNDITVHQFPGKIRQLEAYRHCLQYHGEESQWIAMIDADEFLHPLVADSVPALLKDYEEFGGLHVSWRIFGSSGHVDKPDGLLIESYTRRAVDEHPENRHVKSIVQPRFVLAPSGQPHSFRYRAGSFAADENRNTVNGPFMRHTAARICINHYVLRSRADFHEKIVRWRAGIPPERSMDYFERIDPESNEIEDTLIQRFIPRLIEMG